MSDLDAAICGHLHRLEWVAPMPRREPCAGCCELADAIADKSYLLAWTDEPQKRPILLTFPNRSHTNPQIGETA